MCVRMKRNERLSADVSHKYIQPVHLTEWGKPEHEMYPLSPAAFVACNDKLLQTWSTHTQNHLISAMCVFWSELMLGHQRLGGQETH